MGDKNLNAIEAEIEQTRERLAASIDQLAYRAHPKTIASRQVTAIRNFFLDADGAPRQDNIIKVVGGVVGIVVTLRLVRKAVG